jgi:membrane fusion protein (multidrug efflux system)
LAIAFILLRAVLPTGYRYWDAASHFEAADDAYIAARQLAIAPEVSGYITAVPVIDNEHVAAGGLIARIDDVLDAGPCCGDLRHGLGECRAVGAIVAQQQAARYRYLATTIAGTVQNAQQYTSELHQQQATLENAQASLKLAQRQIEALQAQRDSAVAGLAQARAQRKQAQLNLSDTTVTADQPGRVVQLSAAVGQYAQPGTNLTMFVPDDIWVWANFKETQLDAMRPGQKAAIDIGAYPEHAIRGHVASVQPGSGTAFSLLLAENATRNWVKIDAPDRRLLVKH